MPAPGMTFAHSFFLFQATAGRQCLAHPRISALSDRLVVYCAPRTTPYLPIANGRVCTFHVCMSSGVFQHFSFCTHLIHTVPLRHATPRNAQLYRPSVAYSETQHATPSLDHQVLVSHHHSTYHTLCFPKIIYFRVIILLRLLFKDSIFIFVITGQLEVLGKQASGNAPQTGQAITFQGPLAGLRLK